MQIAFHTICGLAAGVWSQDFRWILRLPKLPQAKRVWVNTCRTVSSMMPLGKMKHSGIGRESGIDAVNEYLRKDYRDFYSEGFAR